MQIEHGCSKIYIFKNVRQWRIKGSCPSLLGYSFIKKKHKVIDKTTLSIAFSAILFKAETVSFYCQFSPLTSNNKYNTQNNKNKLN